MADSTSKANQPPKFGGDKTYERWKTEIEGWKLVTKVEKKSQAITVALSFDEGSEVRDKVFSELDIDKLHVEEGLKTLIENLDKWYLKDSLSSAYESWSNFYKFKRSENCSMETYILEFLKRYKVLKKNKIEIPNSVLAFILLDCAGLEHRDKQLVLTAVNFNEPEKLLDQMSAALRKFFGEQGASASLGENSASSISIKPEPVFVTEEANIMNRNKKFESDRRRPTYNGSSYRGNSRKNPSDARGNTYKCFECGSQYHLKYSCPRRVYEVKSDYRYNEKHDEQCYLTIEKKDTRKIMVDSLNCAVLDSACSSTVCGLNWLNCFLDTLSVVDLKRVVEEESSTSFKFGDGSVIKSLKRVIFPAVLAGEKCTIKTDVIDSDIPLLFGKPSMKKAKVKIDLENDCASVCGKHVDLHCTSSGHYCIPLSDFKEGNKQIHQVLMMEGWDYVDQDHIEKQVEKLHKQFGHPSCKRLNQLIKDGGLKYKDYCDFVEKISDACDICKKFRRTPSKPVVCMPMAKEFNETVAIDLKEWKKGEVYFLHLIDVATRFSRSAVIYSKEKKVVIDKVIEIWIGTGIGSPLKILCDNGGEFDNAEFKDMCENFNIRVMSTAAYSPFSNGLCERNHAVIDEMVMKIIADQPKCSLKVALSWAVNSKNCLQMVAGYSPYQLVFGRNPRLPNIMDDSLPALEGTTMSEILASHLNAKHASRQAFIQAESSEKIRRALRHQVRPTGNRFQNGELVYYKRDDSKEWKGPGSVIGQDGKVVIIRHGSSIIRAHSSKVVEKNVNKEWNDGKSDLLDFIRKFFGNHEDRSKDVKLSSEKTLNQNSNAGRKTDAIAVVSDKLEVAPQIGDIQAFPEEKDVLQQDFSSSIGNPGQNEIGNCGAGVRLKTEVPKVGQRISYLENDNIWNTATVVSRAGKATGKYSKWINIHPDNGEIKAVDFGNDVQEWKYIENCSLEHENASGEDTAEVFISSSNENINVVKAKKEELDNWKNFKVYEEVKDNGQSAISVTWVCTEKVIEKKKKTKARLVARGYEEKEKAQSDSPTGNKDTLRIFFVTISSKGWKCKSIDIKAAFLQGKDFHRKVFLRPPKESDSPPGTLWRLKKCVYGLNDAARVWYLTGRNFLLKLGCVQLKTDPAGFYWYHNGQLEGVFLMHVDDYLWGGTINFANKVISKLCTEFMVGQQSSEIFKYIGLEVKQDEKGITLSQNEYLKSIQPIQISPGRANQKADPCNEDEIKKYRSLVGQINWLSTQSRPDVSFDALELSCNMSNTKVENLIQANKCMKKMCMTESFMSFPNLGDLQKVKLITLSDASHANLPDGFSSAGGFIIILVGENGKSCPLAWESKKIRRVVKSTLAAETLAVSDAVDVAYYLGSMLSEIIFGVRDENVIPIVSYVDNYSLFENAYSTKNVNEKRLRIDLASLKQLIQEGHVNLRWIESGRQLADCLTKRGVNTMPLMAMVENGEFEI